MMQQPLTLLPTLLLFLSVVASDGWASSFQLSRVADTSTPIPDGTGTFTHLDFRQPLLSGSNVAFLASGPGQYGIYLFERGVLRRVADLNTPIPGGSGTFTSFGPPALSGSSVAFRGGGDGQEGIYLFNGTVLNRVADLNTPIPDGSRNFDFDFFGPPALSGGIVAFSGGSVNGQEGIYLFNGTALSRVADLNTRIPGGTGTFTAGTFTLGAPPLLSGGNVAFLGTGSSGQQGIYLYEGGVLVRVADGNTPIPGANVNFVAFLSPALSGGNVAFLGTDLSRGHLGIYLSQSGVLRRVADVNTPIPGGSGNFRVTDLSYPALSGGNVAFLAFGSSEQMGIYLFEDGVLRRVADRNTPIPGESGNFDAFLPPALSGGNVAFLGTGGPLDQRGIYLFEGGGLSRVADLNTPIPGGSGNFTGFGAPDLSGENVAFHGNGSNNQDGIYLAQRQSARLVNISARGLVGTGNDQVIGGLIVQGTTPKTVLLRGRGPSLGGAPFNIPGALSDPLLRLFSGSTVIGQNDNWQDVPNCSPGLACGTASQIAATGLDPCQPNPGQTAPPPNCALESAILVTLPPGAYTFILSGAAAETGLGLVEAFDVDGDTTSAKLHNISTRGIVGNGNDILIGGVIIEGSSPKQVLVRGRGPSLGDDPFLIPGVLPDPVLVIFSGATPIAQNDNWQDAPSCNPGFQCGTPAEIVATGLDSCRPNPGQGGPPPNCDLESAILIKLAPGAYTVQLSGVGGQSGVGLVEVFEIPF